MLPYMPPCGICESICSLVGAPGGEPPCGLNVGWLALEPIQPPTVFFAQLEEDHIIVLRPSVLESVYRAKSDPTVKPQRLLVVRRHRSQGDLLAPLHEQPVKRRPSQPANGDRRLDGYV